MIITHAALSFVLGLFCGRSRAADWISTQNTEIAASQSRELAHWLAAYARKHVPSEKLTMMLRGMPLVPC
ncbi:MAG: hypothetical protein AAB268_09995 [Elusimicrobiota bacterium]